MSISPQDIHAKEFREAFRGYNEDDVDSFLDQVAEEYARLFQENQRLRIQVSTLQQEVGRVRESSDQELRSAYDQARGQARTETKDDMRRALVAAQKAADTALAEARAKAQQLLSDAERRAKEMDERTAARARELDPNAAMTIETLRERIEELRRLETEVRNRIREMLEEQLSVLDRSEAAERHSATVERMAQDLNDGGGEAQRFWKKPRP